MFTLSPPSCLQLITQTHRITGPAETANVRPLSEQHEPPTQQCFGAAAYSWDVWQPTHYQRAFDSSACGAAWLKSRVTAGVQLVFALACRRSYSDRCLCCLVHAGMCATATGKAPACTPLSNRQGSCCTSVPPQQRNSSSSQRQRQRQLTRSPCCLVGVPEDPGSCDIHPQQMQLEARGCAGAGLRSGAYCR
jgi:hypothetical protein